MNLQNLLQENGMLSMIKITQVMLKEMKIVQPLNSKLKSLNQTFVIIQTYILVTGDIAATGNDANTKVAFKNCAPFMKCITHINDEHVDGANNLDIIMSMYNFIEYSDNYSDISGILWQFKRDESPVTNYGNPDNVSTANSMPFKYKSSSIGESTVVAGNRVFKDVKIAVPLKYLSNFWRLLEFH